MNTITIPPTLGESATSAGYLKIDGRCVEQEGFRVYMTRLFESLVEEFIYGPAKGEKNMNYNSNLVEENESVG